MRSTVSHEHSGNLNIYLLQPEFNSMQFNTINNGMGQLLICGFDRYCVTFVI